MGAFTSKIHSADGMGGENEPTAEADAKSILHVTGFMLANTFKKIQEIGMNEVLPNHVVHRYNPSDGTHSEVKLLEAVTPRLTVLNFGSCTYVI